AAPAAPAALMPSGSFDVLPAQAFAPEAVPVADEPPPDFALDEEPAPAAVPAAAAIPAVSILASPPPAPAPQPPPPPRPAPPPPAPAAAGPAAPPPPAPARPAAAPPPPAPAAPAPRAPAMAPTARPRLIVVRGVRTNVEYPIYEGENFIGRSDESPTDIDL